MASENYSISIKLISNLKPCNVGHKTGDEWIWADKAPSGLCSFAFNSLYPFALVLKYGGNFPWQDNPDVLTQSCPDSDVVNTFELRRTPEKGEKAGLYKLSLKLTGKGSTGTCGAGHKEGDEWILGYHTPENLCPSAYRIIYNTAMVLQYGGTFPWQRDPDVMTVTCPDPNVLNQFEIRRTPVK